jgi:hypothetical protein
MLPTISVLQEETPHGRSDGGQSSNREYEEAVIFDATPVGKEANTSFGKSIPISSPQFDSIPVENKQSSSTWKVFYSISDRNTYF